MTPQERAEQIIATGPIKMARRLVELEPTSPETTAREIAKHLIKARTALANPSQLGLIAMRDRHIFAIDALDQAIDLCIDEDGEPRWAPTRFRTSTHGPGADCDPEN